MLSRFDNRYWAKDIWLLLQRPKASTGRIAPTRLLFNWSETPSLVELHWESPPSKMYITLHKKYTSTTRHRQETCLLSLSLPSNLQSKLKHIEEERVQLHSEKDANSILGASGALPFLDLPILILKSSIAEVSSSDSSCNIESGKSSLRWIMSCSNFCSSNCKENSSLGNMCLACSHRDYMAGSMAGRSRVLCLNLADCSTSLKCWQTIPKMILLTGYTAVLYFFVHSSLSRIWATLHCKVFTLPSISWAALQLQHAFWQEHLLQPQMFLIGPAIAKNSFSRPLLETVPRQREEGIAQHHNAICLCIQFNPMHWATVSILYVLI